MTGKLDCEVLVVGAGPTGLMAANLLRRAGVEVRIVEGRTAATRESRAFAVQARTLELMRSIGLAETFVSQGVVARGVNIHIRGRLKGGLDFSRANAKDTPYPFILMIPQSQTEAILGADCEALGITIERGVSVLSVSQDDASALGGVTTHVQSPEGEQIIRSAYVIGADGSRSVVRSDGDFGWHGDMLPQRFLLADCKVDWPLDHDQFRVFLNRERIGLFLPLDGSRLSRVMATDLSQQGVDADGTVPAPLDLDEMERGLSEAVGFPVTLSTPVWVTRYRAHHRFVDRYRNGRMFVAGDAAHIHSPAGGQGMNTGLQDAANLAWKLAAVLHRSADDALLDSYDSERRPVGEEVVRSTGKLFAAAAGQTGWRARVRDQLVGAVLPLVSRLKPFQTKAFLRTSQRGIAYPQSIFVEGVGAGARAPDAVIGNEQTVFDLLGGYQFTVLALVGREVSVNEQSFLGPLRRSHVAVHVVQCRKNAILAERYQVATDEVAILLIRPDGYIAWRGNDAAACAKFIRRFHREATYD